MTSILSVYWSPHHGRGSDVDYIRVLQPNWIRIHQPTARAIWLAQEAAPEAKILLRSWDIDDHNGDRKRELYENPKQAADLLLKRWKGLLGDLLDELMRNNWDYNTDQWVLGLWNEPDNEHLSQVVEGTAEAMRLAKGWLLGVGIPGVGRFPKPDEPGPNWNLFKPLERAIIDGGHVLVCHEYWQPEGPSAVWIDHEGKQRHDAGNLAWRHRHVPLNVPILIGESGANGYIYNRHADKDDGGWQRYRNHPQLQLTPQRYAAQVQEYIRGCDTRVQGVCLYMTDYHSDQWRSFDTEPAHADLLSVRHTVPAQLPPAINGHNVHVPIAGGPQPPTAQPTKPTNLAHPIADPAMRVLSQRFGANPAAYAPLGVRGHTGVDYAVPIGTPVRAVDTGMVLEAMEDEDGWGKYVKIGHTWGQSLYAHLNRQDVNFGQVVQHGQVVGLSGNTGHSTGPHLHLGIRLNPIRRGASDPAGMDGWTDPLPYLQDAATSVWGIIQAAATEYGVDRYLLASLLWAESSWRPDAVSSRGAKGLGQLMPATWDEWAGHVGARNPFDAKDNARVTAAYLGWLTRTLGNNTLKALHAYVWGIGRVMAGNTPPPEVVEYGTKILHGRDLLRAVLG